MKNWPAQNIISKAGQFLFLCILCVACVLSLSQSVSAFNYVRLPNRSLTIGDATPGATTTYTLRWSYPSAAVIGSIRLQLCTDGFVLDTCTDPNGDFSAATFTSQSGVTGFSILSQSSNEIILSRAPAAGAAVASVYQFANVDNPAGLSDKFYVRIYTYATSNATGAPNEISSAVSATTEPITINTEVPPILFFCTGLTIDEWCVNVNGNQIDYGTLSATATDFATSQFGVATNALGGYIVTINGATMTSGFHSIDPINPSAGSAIGTAQFGLNLRANTTPAVGQDVIGSGIGTVSANYNTPDQFLYNSGDTVATSVTGTLFNTFTASYIVNVPPDQAAGVYTTTIAYICTAAF